MRVSVQYATMIVKCLEESVAFYRDVLGFREGYHVDLPAGGITIMKSPEGAGVELIESPQFETGLYSVGTDVDDLEAALEHIRAMGCEPLGDIAATTVGRMAFVRDPNGVRVCLIEHTDEYRRAWL